MHCAGNVEVLLQWSEIADRRIDDLCETRSWLFPSFLSRGNFFTQSSTCLLNMSFGLAQIRSSSPGTCPQKNTCFLDRLNENAQVIKTKLNLVNKDTNIKTF